MPNLNFSWNLLLPKRPKKLTQKLIFKWCATAAVFYIQSQRASRLWLDDMHIRLSYQKSLINILSQNWKAIIAHINVLWYALFPVRIKLPLDVAILGSDLLLLALAWILGCFNTWPSNLGIKHRIQVKPRPTAMDHSGCSFYNLEKKCKNYSMISF